MQPFDSFMRAPRLRYAVLPLTLALVACGKKEAPLGLTDAGASTPSTKGASVAVQPERPAGFDFAGTVAGKPTEFRSAVVAKRPGSDVLHLLVSTHTRTCKDLEAGYGLAKGETVFSIAVAPGLAPSRPGEWFVTDSYYDGASAVGGRKVDVKVDGTDPTKSIGVTLGKLRLEGFKKEAPIEAQGKVVATGCGVVEKKTTGPGAPGPARPQPDLTFKVGGTKLDVLGARYETNAKRIVLSTGRLSCTTSFSEVDVSLLLDPEGKIVNLQGFRIGSFSGSSPKPSPKVTLGPITGQEATLTVKGSFTHDDWPVELNGKATLLVCD